jgi:hypothetical protein
MPKGFFSQGVAVLLKNEVSLDEMADALGEFEIVNRVESTESWEFGGPSLTLAYRREVNGLVSVDIVAQPWPDEMGHPQEAPTLFGAWSMGHFGPFAFPGSLQRAVAHDYVWRDAKTVVPQHGAFLRIRASYIFGAGDDAPVLPADYDAIGELHFVTGVATALLKLPQALCYFNPNGEIALDRATLEESLAYDREQQLTPLDVWSNVRMFRLDEPWTMFDLVGMGQLDAPDQEACFAGTRYDGSAVAGFLRNIALYVLQNGEVIKDGDTTDGPGSMRWRAYSFDESLADPPRRVLRWLPDDGQTPLPEFGFPAAQKQKKRFFWQ